MAPVFVCVCGNGLNEERQDISSAPVWQDTGISLDTFVRISVTGADNSNGKHAAGESLPTARMQRERVCAEGLRDLVCVSVCVLITSVQCASMSVISLI